MTIDFDLEIRKWSLGTLMERLQEAESLKKF